MNTSRPLSNPVVRHPRSPRAATPLAAAILLACGAPPIGARAAAPPADPAPAAATPANTELSAAQAGYLFGLTFGEQLHRLGVAGELSPEDVARGFKAAQGGAKSSPQDQQHLQAYVRATENAAAARNKAAAQAFLAKNGHVKGVQTTASGLQYRVLTAGDATAPLIDAADTVTVNYRGTLIDGTEFDASSTHGGPATFPVNGVIRGWQEALTLMRPGDKWQLFIPPELAYGESTRGPIPGGSLLVFDVEVVNVKRHSPPAPAAAPSVPKDAPPPVRGASKPLDH